MDAIAREAGEMKFKSKVDELYDRLRAEGKVTELPAEQVAEMYARIDKEMREFRTELRRKQAQSYADTARIILTD